MISLGTAPISILAMFGLPGYLEVLIIAGAILLLFGGKKLPELARGMGKGITEFKKGLQGVKEEIDSAGDEPEEPAKKTEPTPEKEEKKAEDSSQ